MSGRLAIPVDLRAVTAFCDRFGVAEFSLFGPVLREDFDGESDVDVMISLRQGVTMTPELYLDMRDELSAMFAGRNVDLIQERLLTNPFRRREIMETREVLYAA